ncbi:kininogen-1 [Drosophila rhopaloa]|uniref:Kininogen-1-like n=1 Tax=Drosophila rhopaloa TaxID=1041015 RepID=A0A6P4E9P8_DRORH|nr:kininogen-1 [Drosophila rhopaloa]
MFKLFVFLAFCLALSCAAPGLLHSSPILTSSYHSLPSVRVIHQPIWTTSHSVVHPIGYGGYGHGHGHGLGHGHGYGWI